MDKVLLIDCQVFQTPAWHRGMGKYSLELLASLDQNTQFGSSRKITLLFNQNLPMDEDMMATIKQAVPGAAISKVDLKYRRDTSYLPKLLDSNRVVIDQYVEKNYADHEVEFLILSLFLVEGATSFPTNSKKIILMYDLIMLQFFEMYLGLGHSDQHFGHYRTLFEADLYLTISETVANDLVTLLGISRDRIVSIDGGPIGRDSSKASQPAAVPDKPFILMPTGGDFRKNNHRGVRGFEKFNRQQGGKYQLVLTSTFGDSVVHALNNISPSLYFTGNVTESELAWYYKHCQGVLFPSEYEGLGLPVLEAVDFKKPVACSDISVFREISTEAFYYFDPYNIAHIAEALEDMMSGQDWQSKLADYGGITTRYSWTKSTEAMAKAIEGLEPRRRSQQRQQRAIAAPNIMIDNLLGRFVALQHDRSNQDHDVSYYYDLGFKPRPVRPSYLAFCAEAKELASFGSKQYRGFDVVDYHVADNKGSVHTLMKALALPGDVYIHSPSLKNLYAACKDQGYISTERLAIETKLAELNGSAAWLVSLALAAKRLFVFDKDLYEEAAALLGRLKCDTTVELLEFPEQALVYKLASSLRQTTCVGLLVGRDIDQARRAFELAAKKWEADVSFKVFLSGIREEKYFEELGIYYPNFTPHLSTTDYGLETFMQQIDIYYSFEDSRQTTVKLIENDAERHGVQVVKAALD